MTAKRKILRQQRRWAQWAGLTPDDNGYLESYEYNLRKPLSEATLKTFQERGRAEFMPGLRAPAKMRALHSSAILAVNIFEHWQPRNAAALLRAMAIEDELAAPALFEERFPTGLEGLPPNVDVVLRLSSGLIVGIESKFTEWLAPKRRRHDPFKAKYFDGGELWTQNGLSRCQALANDLMQRREHFEVLDVPQLLKHALGMAKCHGELFSLRYFYYDFECAESQLHKIEIERFAQRVDAQLRFGAMSYQELYRSLCAGGDVDENYMSYLKTRYFPGGL